MARTAATEDARAAALEAFLKSTNNKKAGAVFTANSVATDVDAISTGALNLDYALGCGGLPRGRLIELYGPEMSGKTTLALSTGATAIREHGSMMGYVDVENAINFDHVRDMGVDLRYFALSQPDSGEEALQMLETMANSRQFAVLALDSIAALVPQAELEGDIGDIHVGLTARLMSQGLRKLARVANETNTMIIFINQLREKIGGYGNPETTPGGKAMKYYASVRLEVRSPASARINVGSGQNQQAIGQRTKVTVKKNKMAAPFKWAEYDLIYGKGIDRIGTVFETAVATGVWIHKGSGIYLDGLTGETLGRGKDNLIAMLKDNPELADKVTGLVYDQMRGAVSLDPIDDEPMSADEIAQVA